MVGISTIAFPACFYFAKGKSNANIIQTTLFFSGGKREIRRAARWGGEGQFAPGPGFEGPHVRGPPMDFLIRGKSGDK